MEYGAPPDMDCCIYTHRSAAWHRQIGKLKSRRCPVPFLSGLVWSGLVLSRAQADTVAATVTATKAAATVQP